MTPRRILLLVGGLVTFVVAYFLYARFFGWLDGLPVLPSKMLTPSEGTYRLPDRPTSPTVEKIKLAWGDTSPETESANYPTQLEFQYSPETSIVIATGGFATMLAPESTTIETFDEFLTLEGLRLIHRRNQ